MFGIGSDGLLFVGIHAIVNPVHHANPWIGAQLGAVTIEKIPIKVIKWAGLWAVFGRDAIAAAFAIVGHFVDIAPARGIGFAGQFTAIGKERHARHIWQFNPFGGIGINA